MKALFKNVFGKIAIIACVLCIVLCINEPISSYAKGLVCVDNNGDSYCDTCGKSMDEGVVVATGSVRCSHTHYGSGGGTSPNGCYDEPYNSYEKIGTTICGQPITESNFYYNDTTNGPCPQCDQIPCLGHVWGICSEGHEGPNTDYCTHIDDAYGNVTRYTCTKKTIDCGTADMIKTGNTLSIRFSLDSSVICNITGYEWKYNGAVISTSSSATMISIGNYTCTISYSATGSAGGHAASATTVLAYVAPITSFTNNAFHIEKTATDSGYNLKFVQNADYASYYTLYSLKWTYAKNAQTWDILPFKSGSETNNPLFVQNCGDYTCTYTIKGNDGTVYTYTLTYSLNNFDARIAAYLARNVKESFACTWDYYSLQNIYNQAEQLNITDIQNNGTTLKKTPIMVFDSNHNLKATETVENVVKTFNGVGNSVSEVIKYDCTFALTNHVLGTCTKKGSSTITATLTASVYFKNSSDGELYYSYSVPISSFSTKEVGKNLNNHDCEIKSYEWKDNNGDAINDYLYITRDCPASNGNWLITVNLWPKDTDFKDKLFTITHSEDIHSSESACKTVYTTVKYEYLKGKYTTYNTTDHAKHKYSSTYTLANCLNNGHRDYTCEYCGYEYSVKTSDPLGHSYMWKTTKSMTLNEDGESTGTCTRCGAITTKVIPSIHITLQQRTNFTNIPTFDPTIYEKTLNSKDPWDRTQYYWDLLGLYHTSGNNRSLWEWNSDIGHYVWNGEGNPWEWSGAIGRYSFMSDPTLWEWNSDIGRYVWNGEGNPWEWNSDIGRYSFTSNSTLWEWNSNISHYVWNGEGNPWEWNGAIGRYSFMSDPALWEWNSDIGRYVWNGEGDEYSFGAGIRIGGSATPRFDGLSLLSNVGDNKSMNLSITAYEPKEDEKENFLDKIKDVLRDILNALKNLINFFREHPELVVASILFTVLTVASVILYALMKKDRIRFRKENAE